jgi:hypothetical protein
MLIYFIALLSYRITLNAIKADRKNPIKIFFFMKFHLK